MTHRRALRLALWLGVAVLVFLAGRYLAYALAPRPTLEAARLGRTTGGARPLELALGLLAGAAALSAAMLAVATAAVRQRRLTAPGASLRPPAPSAAGVLFTAVALWGSTSAAFGLVEWRIHAVAGLRMSPLHCLVGPIHRDVLPIFAALSLLAAALTAAADYLAVWLRRTIDVLRHAPLVPVRAALESVAPWIDRLLPASPPRALGSRGPPRLLVG
jgi:hypothetical protein